MSSLSRLGHPFHFLFWGFSRRCRVQPNEFPSGRFDFILFHSPIACCSFNLVLEVTVGTVPVWQQSREVSGSRSEFSSFLHPLPFWAWIDFMRRNESSHSYSLITCVKDDQGRFSFLSQRVWTFPSSFLLFLYWRTFSPVFLIPSPGFFPPLTRKREEPQEWVAWNHPFCDIYLRFFFDSTMSDKAACCC